MRGTTQRSRLVSSGSAAPHKVAKSLRQSQWPVMDRMDEGMTTTDAVWRCEGGGSGPQQAHPSMSPPAAAHAVSGGGPPPSGLWVKGSGLRSGLDSSMESVHEREGAGVIDTTQRLRLSYLDAASALLLQMQ